MLTTVTLILYQCLVWVTANKMTRFSFYIQVSLLCVLFQSFDYSNVFPLIPVYSQRLFSVIIGEKYDQWALISLSPFFFLFFHMVASVSNQRRLGLYLIIMRVGEFGW